MQNKYIALIVSYVNCKHAKGWENEKGKITCVCVGIDLRCEYIWILWLIEFSGIVHVYNVKLWDVLYYECLPMCMNLGDWMGSIWLR